MITFSTNYALNRTYGLVYGLHHDSSKVVRGWVTSISEHSTINLNFPLPKFLFGLSYSRFRISLPLQVNIRYHKLVEVVKVDETDFLNEIVIVRKIDFFLEESLT